MNRSNEHQSRLKYQISDQLRSKQAKPFSPCRNEDALSEDSFHSFSSQNCRKEFSNSYAQDLVNSLGNDYLSDEQKISILNKLLNLPVKFNIKMAQGTESYLKKFSFFYMHRLLFRVVVRYLGLGVKDLGCGVVRLKAVV